MHLKTGDMISVGIKCQKRSEKCVKIYESPKRIAKRYMKTSTNTKNQHKCININIKKSTQT